MPQPSCCAVNEADAAPRVDIHSGPRHCCSADADWRGGGVHNAELLGVARAASVQHHAAAGHDYRLAHCPDISRCYRAFGAVAKGGRINPAKLCGDVRRAAAAAGDCQHPVVWCSGYCFRQHVADVVRGLHGRCRKAAGALCGGGSANKLKLRWRAGCGWAVQHQPHFADGVDGIIPRADPGCVGEQTAVGPLQQWYQ